MEKIMPYSSLATLYDRINGEIYAPYAEFLDGAIRKYSEIPVQDVLDLGCGTGKITALMADKG
ncbi:MAG: class I SAM-dependent methyltransferase, partial [Clostridiales bacterium]|nr:class I SAM-dependent methyltransferase [Candidatus Coliplasma caballi]